MAEGSLSLSLLTCWETVRTCVPTIVESLRGPVARARSTARLAEWADRITRRAEIDLHVHGLEHVDPKVTCVVMSNHQSHFDIFVLFKAFPGVLRMVAKVELSRVPILGGGMTASEFVFLDRGDRAHALAALRLAGERIRSGINVWIAPEGTQSRDGALLPFKKGGFILAEEAGVPILPVTVEGTRHVLPAKQTRVRSGQRVDVTFHAPVDPRAFGSRDQVIAEVRRRIESALPAAQRRGENLTAG
jgi:1-acyl-sn-glycerol-3-phosphate acyltransferase